jgi:hypothetical protein
MAEQPAGERIQAAAWQASARSRARAALRAWRSTPDVEAGPRPMESSTGDALQLAQRRPRADERVVANRSLLGHVRGRRIELRQSASALTVGRDVRVRRGAGVILAGGRLNVERAGGQWLVGGLVQARQVFAVAVVAGKIEGQVRCLFDARGAFAFGAGVALMSGLLRLVLRRSK